MTDANSDTTVPSPEPDPGADHRATQATRFELGVTRLQQKRYAEAAPLLVQAVAGMESTTPEPRIDLAEGLRRLVQLYDGWGKKDKADEGRQKLDDQKKP